MSEWADGGPTTTEIRARALLDAWEGAVGKRPATRALALLEGSDAGARGALTSLSVGERDRRLLELRRALFGSGVAALATCPGCEETVELEFELEAIMVRQPPADEPPLTVDVMTADRTLRVRVPTAADLAAAGEQADVLGSRTALLDALLVEGPAGPPPAAEALSEDEIALIDSALAATDPQADVSLNAACPTCATRWDCSFDVGAFLWSEVDDWATRLLWDIQTLAAAYGWREADALALSRARRRFYVEAAHA